LINGYRREGAQQISRTDSGQVCSQKKFRINQNSLPGSALHGNEFWLQDRNSDIMLSHLLGGGLIKKKYRKLAICGPEGHALILSAEERSAARCAKVWFQRSGGSREVPLPQIPFSGRCAILAFFLFRAPSQDV
jgi:hypothetical protein